MAAVTTEVGERIEIKLAHCNFTMESKNCWFNDAKASIRHDSVFSIPRGRINVNYIPLMSFLHCDKCLHDERAIHTYIHRRVAHL